jgi:hypothetical protein
MGKKINSEYKIDDNNYFTVTMGTYNKKTPEVIYSILSTYITPNNDNVDEEFFNEVPKNIKKTLKSRINSYGLCDNNVIVVSDVAVNRMFKGKQSYFDMEIYFKPTQETLKNKDKIFKHISNDIYNVYVKNIVNDIEKEFKNNGFIISKLKNKKCNINN